MKRTILLLLLPSLSSAAFAQQKEAAEKLVEEGIAYHDKGDFEGAPVEKGQLLVELA